MEQRALGTTGITVSVLGLGGWQLANPDWGTADASEAQHIVQAALDSGCTFFDTAPSYGAGRSEELLGQALKPVRQHVVLCTKFGHTADGTTHFEAEAIRPALEASLRRLQTDYVDVYLLHNPPRAVLDGRHVAHYAVLEQLKAEGKLRVYGVSADTRQDLETVITTTRSGAIEVLFNVFHQAPRAAFPHAQARGVGLIVKVPLDSGWLTGKYRDESRFSDVRRRWSPDVIARRAKLVERFAALVPAGTPLAHAAIQYCLAQPEVATVIPGAKQVAQLRDNVAAAAGRLPAEVVQAITALWERELQEDPLPW